MSLRDQLQQVYDEYGRLTPALVVDEARDPEHPLHGRFEWDDSAAAEKWRRQQAHELIRSVRVVYREADESGGPKSVRAYHAVPTDEGHVYEPLEKITENDVMRQIVRQQMERDWKDLKRRYAEFEEFLQLVRNDIAAA